MVLDGRLAPTAISTQPQGIDFPAMSVNRGKYSQPEDVRLAIRKVDPNWDSWGIAEFVVGDVPFEPDDNTKSDNLTYEWTWRMAHGPESENYAHTEIRTFRNGTFRRDVSVPKSIKKWFRLALSPKTKVIADPKI